jgi:CRP-like cAMP-binding protein
MDYDLLLKNIGKHISLLPEEEEKVLSKLTERRFRKGEFINSEGEINRYTNFVVKGSARTFYIDNNGHEHIIQLAIREWWIGDFTSFISQQPGMLYTMALENLEMLSLTYENLQTLYREVPKLERFFRILIQKAYASFQLRTLQNLSFDAEQRYISFRNAYPEMDQQISQKHIASYLGMSAEFLSKIKKRIVERERRSKKEL